MRDARKIIQALTYLAYKQENKELDNMKAYKLLWLADRYHVRHHGRTVSGDTYYALPHGIVPSNAKYFIENKPAKLKLSRKYRDSFISVSGNHSYRAIQEPDMSEFSISDIEALDKVLEAYNHLSPKELSNLSHKFPEWKYYERVIQDKEQGNAYPVNMLHFFESAPAADKSGLFEDSPELIELSREVFRQLNRV